MPFACGIVLARGFTGPIDRRTGFWLARLSLRYIGPAHESVI
jgi:hypothetical protein